MYSIGAVRTGKASICSYIHLFFVHKFYRILIEQRRNQQKVQLPTRRHSGNVTSSKENKLGFLLLCFTTSSQKWPTKTSQTSNRAKWPKRSVIWWRQRQITNTLPNRHQVLSATCKTSLLLLIEWTSYSSVLTVDTNTAGQLAIAFHTQHSHVICKTAGVRFHVLADLVRFLTTKISVIRAFIMRPNHRHCDLQKSTTTLEIAVYLHDVWGRANSHSQSVSERC